MPEYKYVTYEEPKQGVPDWKTAPPVVPAVKDLVRSPDPVG
jgi:hypothetical protein